MLKTMPAQPVKPTPLAVDAVVLAEKTKQAPAHSLPNERMFLSVFSVLIVVSIIFLGQKVAAFQSVGGPFGVQAHAPIVVHQAVAGVSVTNKGRETAMLKTIKTAKSVHYIAKNLHKTALPAAGAHLDASGYQQMLLYLAEKEGIALEADARDVLEQAGYVLPASITPIVQTENAAPDVAAHIDFARDVVSTIVRDEVEGFLGKVRLISKIGVYVAEQGAAPHPHP